MDIMRQSLPPINGSWDQYLTLFEMFDRARVPSDSRWRSLLLYFRDVKDYTHLTDGQKVEIQGLLTYILETRDYTDKHLNVVLKKYQAIIAKPYQGKVDALLREAADVISSFQKLLSVRCGDINNLEEESVTIVADECDSIEPILKLRNAFTRVKTMLEDDMRNLENMAACDGLTKLANRRAFDAFIDEAMNEWLASSRPLGLALFDIDHFKRFNDEHGHRIGDQVLVVVGAHLQKVLETFDAKRNKVMVARYGGEEFVMAISGPDAPNLAAATEKCRERIQKFNFLIRDAEGNVVESGLHITTSAGVAAAWPGWKTAHIENLVDSADKALYFAKQSGRNKVAEFHPDGKTMFTLVTN